MKEFLTMKEFSGLSGIEPTTLRYWDEIGLFSPIKRNPENNYRYYAVSQLLPLNFISVLSDIQITLKTIGELDNDREPDKISKMLNRQEKMLDMEVQRLRECYSIIHARRELINYGMKINNTVDITTISVMHREEKTLAFGPRCEYQPGETFLEAVATLVKQSKKLRINLSLPVGGYYDSLERFSKSPLQPDHLFSIDPTGRERREAGDYVIGFARGGYGEFGDLPERMTSYARENSLRIHGPVFVMYLFDEICCKDPSQYLVQAHIAVGRRKLRHR